MSPISKEKENKQEHEEISEMALEKMKTKDSSPEEQTESPEQGHQEVANFMAGVTGHVILKCSNEESPNMNIYVYFYLISTDL